MATIKTVIQILAVFELSFPRAEMKPGMSKVWYELLKDIPDDILEVAASQVAAENTFFPAVAEVRNKALKLMKPTYPTWGEAWEECISYGNKFSWEQNGFGHPLIEKAYNIIGNWDTLLTDDIPTVRAQFRQVYESLVFRAESDIKMLPESKEISDKYRLEVSELVKKLEAKN
jgi:hypothetical protein